MNTQEKELDNLYRQATRLSINYNLVKHEFDYLGFGSYRITFRSQRSKFWKDSYNEIKNGWFLFRVWFVEKSPGDVFVYENYVSKNENYALVIRSKEFSMIEVTNGEFIALSDRKRADWCISNSSPYPNLYQEV